MPKSKLAIILKLNCLVTCNYEELAQSTFNKLVDLAKNSTSSTLLNKVSTDPSFRNSYLKEFIAHFEALHNDPSLDSDTLLLYNLQKIFKDNELSSIVSKECSTAGYSLFHNAKEALQQLTQYTFFIYSPLPFDITKEILEKLEVSKEVKENFCEVKDLETVIRQVEEMEYEKYNICVIGDMLDTDIKLAIDKGVRTGWLTAKPWNEARNNKNITLVNNIDFAFTDYLQLPALLEILKEDSIFINEAGKKDYRKLDLPIKKRVRVGYYFPPEKVKEMVDKKFIISNEKILFYPIQINASLEDQGPMIGLVHKCSDLMVEEFIKKKGKRFTMLQEFTEKYEKTMVTMDPLSRMKLTLYRTNTNNAIETALNTELLKTIMHKHGKKVKLPYSKIIMNNSPDDSLNTIKEDIKASKCNYSFMLKLAESCQTIESHTLAICVNEEGLKEALDLNLYKGKEIIVQQLIKHSATLYKFYTLGSDYITYFAKKSLLSVLPIEDYALFYSQKPFPEEWLASVGKPVDKMDKEFGYEVTRAFMRELNLSILGMDYIIEEETGDYMLIDINYFSSFRNEKNLNSQVTSHILKTYNEKIKGIHEKDNDRKD